MARDEVLFDCAIAPGAGLYGGRQVMRFAIDDVSYGIAFTKEGEAPAWAASLDAPPETAKA
jgi:hypothetical protein